LPWVVPVFDKQEGTNLQRRMRRHDLQYEGRKKFWSGGNGASGVGILVVEYLCDDVIEVRRIDERLMVLVLIYGKQLIRIITRFFYKKYTFCLGVS